MKLRFGSLTLGAVLLSAPVVLSQTLVSWGPSTTYVTSNQAGQRSSSGGVIGFNLTTAITPAANYTGGVFYGGASSTASMNGGFTFSNNNATNGGGNDVLIFGKASAVSSGDAVTGVFLWKQSDFLAGSDVENDNVTVTSFSFTGRVNGSASTGSQARFVIQQGSTYMISDDVGLTTSIGTHTLADPSSVSWYAYDPSSGLSSIGGVVSSPSFEGVTATGLYLSTTSNGANPLYLAFSAVSISGTVSAIPEPGSSAALVGFGAIGCIALRRRKR